MRTRSRWLAASVRLYRLLLKAYPAEFRREYGAAMLQLARDSLCDAFRRRGTLGLMLEWVRVLVDLLITVPREHRATASERRAQLQAAGGIALPAAALPIRRAIRDDLESGALLMIGFVVQSALWYSRSALCGLLALLPIFGILIVVLLLIAARLLLRVHSLRRRSPDAAAALVDAQPALPSGWRRALLIMSALYLIEVLIVPALIPHTGELHNAMMYRWGLPGLLYYAFAGCAVLAAVCLMVPLSIALLLKVCARWRNLAARARATWLAAPALLLLALALTWPSARQFIEWWGD
jgi:hypothetical protein